MPYRHSSFYTSAFSAYLFLSSIYGWKNENLNLSVSKNALLFENINANNSLSAWFISSPFAHNNGAYFDVTKKIITGKFENDIKNNIRLIFAPVGNSFRFLGAFKQVAVCDEVVYKKIPFTLYPKTLSIKSI